MPKKTTEKNTKGQKKPATKKTTSKKVETVKKNVEKQTDKVVVNNVVEKKERKRENSCKSICKRLQDDALLTSLVCIILLLLAALILTLCYKRVPKTSKGNEVLATVNGKTITANDLYKSLKNDYGTETLIGMIDQYISEKEVTIADEDKEYVQGVVDYYKNYADYYSTDLATFLADYVGLKGITTEKEFYNYVLKDYKKTLAVEKFVADNAKEKDLKEYYKNNYSDTLTVKHILIEVDGEAEDKDAADKEAYDKAVKLIKKLRKTDKDKLDETFSELAKDNSDDTGTYSKGGLMEDFTKKDVVEEFWEASYELKDNEFTTEPVKTTYGYHVILKIKSTPVKSFKKLKEEVKKAYAKDLLANDQNLQIKKWDELRKQYKLSIKDDVMKKDYKKTIKSYNSNKDKETEKAENNTEQNNTKENTEE